MNEKLLVTTIAVLVSVSGLADAQDEETQLRFWPSEIYICNYNDGMGPGDLDKAVDAWNKYSDEHDVEDYFAATFTPWYFGADTFDFGWLGGWSSGQAMGEGTDMWLAEGGEYAARLAAVATCGVHSNLATTTIKSPDGDSHPDHRVMTFSDCSYVGGTTFEDVLSGLGAWAAYQAENNYGNGTRMMLPVFGGGDDGFDYTIVESYESHTALGKMYDLYRNGGGYQKYGELLGDLVSCDEARVYNATTRRRMSEEE